jgi:hypothetical protein
MKFLICFLFFLVIASGVKAQDSTAFDQVIYKAPSNWNFTDNGAYRTYSIINNAANTFCIISIYNSDVSSGNADQDFRKAWKGIVAGHFTVIKNLKPQQNKTSSGVSYLQDEANIGSDKGSFFARLLVFDLKEKTQAVLFLSANKNSLAQYQSDLDQFLSSLKQNTSNSLSASTKKDSSSTNQIINTSTTTKTSTTASSNPGLIHFNHFLFKTPAGWKSAQNANYYLLIPPDLESDEMLTYILLSPINNQSFDDAAISTLKEVATSLNGEAVQEQIFDKGPLYIRENEGTYAKGWTYSLGHGTIRIATPNPNSPGIISYQFYYVGVFLVKINSRIERVVYLSKDIRRGFADNSTYRKPTYESVIKNFFFDIEFDDWTDAKANSGKLTHTGISNVWGGLAYFEGSLGSTFFEGSVKATYLVFFDNGQVYYNKELPKEGFNNTNTFTQAALFPRWWGTYTYENGSGVIKLIYVTIPFKLKDGKIYLDIYQKQIPYDQLGTFNDTKLNGTWCSQDAPNGKKDCITFSSNGQFSDDGTIARIEHQINSAFQTIPANGQGSYEIENNSIVFHYNNGFVYQAAFSGLGLQKTDSSPKEIHLGYNDDVFEKN